MGKDLHAKQPLLAEEDGLSRQGTTLNPVPRENASMHIQLSEQLDIIRGRPGPGSATTSGVRTRTASSISTENMDLDRATSKEKPEMHLQGLSSNARAPPTNRLIHQAAMWQAFPNKDWERWIQTHHQRPGQPWEVKAVPELSPFQP